MNSKDVKECECPVCERKFPADIIETHVNKCIFLNTSEATVTAVASCSSSTSVAKRKRTSPDSSFLNKSNSITVNEPPSNSPKKPKNDKSDLCFTTPLAKQVQPACLSEFVGQNHVFGESSVLRVLFEKKEIPNLILWGPPGCGKVRLLFFVCLIESSIIYFYLDFISGRRTRYM